jgi:class 3 adenylate cyclase
MMGDVAGDDDLIGTLEALGASPEAAREAVERGDAQGAVFESVLMADRLERTVSPIDIEAQGGLTVEEITALLEAWGLPPTGPDDGAFTPSEASVLVELGGPLREIWPPEIALPISRVYGRMLARIATAEVQSFLHHAAPRAREQGADPVDELRAVQKAFEQLLPLADPLLTGVHRRWVEHELAQAAVSDAEQRADDGELPGAVSVAFLFCDLKDFTAYANTRGDAAAIAAVDGFFDAISRLRGERGKVVKLLGDGAMLAYDDPADAVAAGARVVAAMRSTELPGVHSSVHYGVAIAREGDYFGSSVNLAARLLALGGRDELVATDPVVEAADAFAWESIGAHRIRGMHGPIEVHRLVI